MSWDFLGAGRNFAPINYVPELGFVNLGPTNVPGPDYANLYNVGINTSAATQPFYMHDEILNAQFVRRQNYNTVPPSLYSGDLLGLFHGPSRMDLLQGPSDLLPPQPFGISNYNGLPFPVGGWAQIGGYTPPPVPQQPPYSPPYPYNCPPGSLPQPPYCPPGFPQFPQIPYCPPGYTPPPPPPSSTNCPPGTQPPPQPPYCPPGYPPPVSQNPFCPPGFYPPPSPPGYPPGYPCPPYPPGYQQLLQNPPYGQFLG